MSIANRLDKAMCVREIESQSALARMSEVPQATISRILKGGGKKGPETATIKKLADALDVRFDWLNEGTGDMPRTARDKDSARSEGWSQLTRVDETELHLLNLLRKADARGRAEIISAVEDVVGRSASAEGVSPDDVAASEHRRRVTDSKTHHLGEVDPLPQRKQDPV